MPSNGMLSTDSSVTEKRNMKLNRKQILVRKVRCCGFSGDGHGTPGVPVRTPGLMVGWCRCSHGGQPLAEHVRRCERTPHPRTSDCGSGS